MNTFFATPGLSRSQSTADMRKSLDFLKRVNNSKVASMEQQTLTELIKDIPASDVHQPNSQSKAQRFFQMMRQKGQVSEETLLQMNKIRCSESRYKITTRVSPQRAKPIDKQKQAYNQLMKRKEEILIRRIFEDLDGKFEENLSILQNHVKLKEFIHNEELRATLDINYMMLNARKQEPLNERTLHEVKLIIYNQLEKFDRNFIQPIIHDSAKTKKFHHLAYEMYKGIGSVFSNMIAIFSKCEPQVAQICESLWKVLLFSYDIMNQYLIDEKARFEKQSLEELRDEIKQSNHQQDQLIDQIYQMKEEFNKKEKQSMYKIQALENQLTHIRSEFQEYKYHQQEMMNLDHATGCLKVIDMDIRESKDTITKMQDQIEDRDLYLKSALKSVVNVYKSTKAGDQNLAQKLEDQYGIDHIRPAFQTIIAQTKYRHPLLTYAIMGQQGGTEHRVRDVLNYLVEWFFKEMANDSSSPSERLIAFIKQQIYIRQPELTQYQIDMAASISVMDIIVDLNDWSLRSEDLEKFTRQERFDFQMARFFSNILGLNKQQAIGSQTFMKFKQMVAETEIEDVVSPGRPNKLLWIAKAVPAFTENSQKYFGIVNILTYLESNVCIVEAFNKIIDWLRFKKREKVEGIIKEFKVYNGTQIQQLEQISLLADRLGRNRFNTEMLLLENYERFLKVLQQGRKKQQSAYLPLQNWEEFVRESCDMVDNLDRLFDNI